MAVDVLKKISVKIDTNAPGQGNTVIIRFQKNVLINPTKK